MHSTLPILHILTSPGREAALARALASLRASDWPCDPVIHVDRCAADTDPRIRNSAAWRNALASATGQPGGWTETEHARAKDRAKRTTTVIPWRAHSDEQRAAKESAFNRHTAQSSSSTRPMVGACSLPEVSGPPILIVEDGVIFHPNLATRLADWPPLTRGCIRTFASLQHSVDAGERAGVTGPTWFAATPTAWAGSQAILLNPAFAAHALASWSLFPGLTHDRRLASIAARDFPGSPIWIHVPSLVEPARDPSVIHAGPVSGIRAAS